MDLKLRPDRPEDADACGRICYKAFAAIARQQNSDYETQRARLADIEACNAVCRQVHGHDRASELTDAVAQNTARVVEHDGRISGYATDLAFSAHAVGESNEDLKALIMATEGLGGPGILVLPPTPTCSAGA